MKDRSTKRSLYIAFSSKGRHIRNVYDYNKWFQVVPVLVPGLPVGVCRPVGPGLFLPEERVGVFLPVIDVGVFRPGVVFSSRVNLRLSRVERVLSTPSSSKSTSLRSLLRPPKMSTLGFGLSLRPGDSSESDLKFVEKDVYDLNEFLLWISS